MKRKINIDRIQDLYIIVVDGQEEKVVYDVDDSCIFSVHITGCGRGARNAVLTEKTFKNLKNTEKGLKYLNSCFMKIPFKGIKVSELKDLSKKGYDWLMIDIYDYNKRIDFQKEWQKKVNAVEKRQKEELNRRISESKLINIEETEDEFILTYQK